MAEKQQQHHSKKRSARTSASHKTEPHTRQRRSRPVRKWWKQMIMHNLGKNATTQDPPMLKLLEAINNENENDVEDLLANEFKDDLERIRRAEINGATLLHYACSRGNAGVVDILVRYGLDVNKKTRSNVDLYLEAYDYVSRFRVGSTPIYIATVAGWQGIVVLLAKHGANPNISDIDGYTPLHSAAWHNKINIVSQLILSGAKINLQDSTGSTPLKKAAYRGHLEAVRHLLNNGADPNIQTKRGRAAIHCAALYGHAEVVALLLQHGAKAHLQDNDNMTALHAAVYNGKRNVVKVLLKANVDINKETKFGNTALHLACMEKWLVIASMLSQAGGDAEKKNRFGESPKSILESGGKRLNIFNTENAPRLSDLEKLELEYRERSLSLSSTLEEKIPLQTPQNGNIKAESLSDMTNSYPKKEKKKKRDRDKERERD